MTSTFPPNQREYEFAHYASKPCQGKEWLCLRGVAV
jgi:hypothetical protein